MSCIDPKMVEVAGYHRNPSDPPKLTETVVVQSHLSKVGQIDLSDVRLKRSPRKRAFLNKLFVLKNYSVNI